MILVVTERAASAPAATLVEPPRLGLADAWVGTAHAGVIGSVTEAAKVGGLSFTDHLFLGIAHTRLTRELYEFLARPFLERVLGWKKPPVPKPA